MTTPRSIRPNEHLARFVAALRARALGADGGGGAWLHVVGPEVQKEGYTERVERSFAVQPDAEGRASAREAG